MPVRPLDGLLALKAISLADGLKANDRRVAATLIEHYNRMTTRCDPGIASISRLLGISERTVMRAVDRLVVAGLFTRIRHGGPGNRNRYEPNWERVAQLEESWKQKRRTNSRASKLSPDGGQARQLQADIAVTQTYKNNNLPKQTCLQQPSEKNGRANFVERHLTTRAGKNSADAARDEAERRWMTAVQRRYIKTPVTYAEVIQAITDEMRLAATNAELGCHGTGLRYILKQLKLGDDP